MSAARSRREELALAALTALPLLPFLGKGISIDAPVFVAVAHQIVAHPADPFGFEMIWDPTSPRAAEFNRNPPLLSYYLAPWIAVFGEREAWLHAAVLPFPLIAALSFLGIARRTTPAGLVPAALLVTTPAFLVLATTLMLDVPTLACLLFSVYALLRGAESDGAGWQLAAGGAAAATGLMKYVGFATAPLLAAGALLLCPRPGRAALRVLLPPLVVWGAWGAYTARLYGAVHFLGSSDVVLHRDADYFWNQVVSTPVFYGGALLFPVAMWARSLRRAGPETMLAVVAVVLGTALVYGVLPGGEPDRRHPLEVDEAVVGALGFAGAFFVWTLCLSPARLRGEPVDRFLWLWLAGFLVFTAFLNWHVNAADALLAAPPVLLLACRHPALRPPPRTAAVWAVLALGLSLGLAWADTQQSNFYREAARRIAVEIGDQPGARYFVGHWGLQHYLEREGFHAVVPPMYGRSDLERGDWVATARNVSQLDVTRNMNEYTIRPVWRWELESSWPLRTTNPDAGAGFYSHHSGYVPFAFSRAPIERVSLGRVVAVRRR